MCLSSVVTSDFYLMVCDQNFWRGARVVDGGGGGGEFSLEMHEEGGSFSENLFEGGGGGG